MSEFTIDEVRGTIGKDVTHFLETIEKAVAGLTATHSALFDGAGPAFQIIGDAGHSIYGTSALVDANSLATSARLLERLAERGQEEMAQSERHAKQARKIAEAARAGAAEMRVMLNLELEHRGVEAEWVALDWSQRTGELLDTAAEGTGAATIRPDESRVAPSDAASAAAASCGKDEAPSFNFDGAEAGGGQELEVVEISDEDFLPVEEPAKPEDEPPFVFEPTADAASQDALDGEIHAELLEIFQGEARECLVGLQAHLEALDANHKDLSAARALERLYHTQKGGAATVGLKSVSGVAHGLQRSMQAVVDDGAAVTSELIDELVSGTATLLETSGLPHVTFTIRRRERRAVAGVPPVEEARATFVEEAREAFEHASGLVVAIGTREGASARRTLARLFHRLKGSALVAKETKIGAVAAHLEKVCDQGEPTTAELSRGLAQLAALAGVPGNHDHLQNATPNASAANADPSSLDEANRSEGAVGSLAVQDDMHRAFVVEARDLWEEASGLVGVLEGSANGVGSTLEVLGQLSSLFHRLQGSALVVGEDAIAKEATNLRHSCEGESATDASPQTLRDGLARIAAALELDASNSRGHEQPIRHAVPTPDPELGQVFAQECAELLETLDGMILELEESDRPREHLAEMLPVYHTLKGIVNTMGLVPTGKAIHRVEDFVVGLRKGNVLPAMRGVTTSLLQVQVDVRRNLKQARRGYVEFSLPKLEAQLERVFATPRLKAQRGASDAEQASEGSFSNGAESAGSAGRSALSGDTVARNFVRIGTDRLDNLMNLAGELVVSRSRLLSRVQALRSIEADLGTSGHRLIATVERFCDEHEFARLGARSVPQAAVYALASGAENGPTMLTSGESNRGAAANDGAWGAFSDIELDRYEDIHVLSRSLMELTSDLDEIHAQVRQDLGALADDSDAFGGIIGGIQAEVTRARMVPLEVLFSRLKLPIRDAAMRQKKEVRVVTEGEAVHLDKTIADALFQPMLHLVRNAVAHGLEAANGRERAGKPQAGTLELYARQELGQIVLEVRDDGMGLNLEQLRARGVAMGLVSESVSTDDPAIKNLVFARGLTTEATAGDVAGRGVGCDFVRRAVERLNGSVHVESDAGKGTRFVLTLPLTLAITRALLVRDGNRSFAIPLYFTERILDAAEQHIVDSAGVRRLRVDDAYLPISTLSSFLGHAPGDTKGPIVMLRSGGERIVLQVDEVVGQEEIVVKSLGAVLTGHPIFAGITVRGTGEMVLILDIPGLAEAKQATLPHVPARPRATQTVRTAQKWTTDDAPSSETRLQVAEKSKDAARRLRALFVDDSLSVRKVAEKSLAALDVDVKVASDGLDALAKMREGTFDVVFTDLEMPRMHGFELVRELRFLAAYKDLPIVVVTSRSGQKHRDQARALGATEYMTKPFTQKSLETVLKKWVRVRQGDA